jgi:N-acetylglucosaminylphosphatidylinositol deacetylase
MSLHFLSIIATLFYVTLTPIAYIFYLIYHNKKNIHLKKKRNVCFLIAHPDDEAMFFGPSIRQFSSNRLFILCMTSGNHYGLGELRKKELLQSCKCLVGPKNLIDVKLVDESQLPDCPKTEWDLNLCSRIVSDYLTENKIDICVTFDKHGVSSHKNHCSLFLVVNRLKSNHQNTIFYVLKTTNFIRKYLFLFDFFITLVISTNRKNKLIAASSFNDYVVTLKAMMRHRSQLMWFRWLYIFSSRYMLMNDLELLTY